MTPFLSAFTGALREFLWQGAAVAGLLWMVLLLLRNRPAQSRYAASCAALGILAVLPAVTAFGRYHGGAAEVLVTMPSSPVWAAVAGIDRPAIGWRAIAEAWTLPLWSLGVAVFSLRMVWACRQVAGFRRRGTPVEEPLLAGLCAKLGIRRAVRVMVSESADGPAVVGWMRPVILLPAAALTGMPADYLEAVLAHELAHVRRHDYLVNLLQMAVETLLFYHPAVWWVSARIRHERELCCDDLAADAAGRLCYARALTAIEKLRVSVPAAAMGAADGRLLYRIQRLIGGSQPQYGMTKVTGVLAVSLALACAAVSVKWAHGQSPAVQTPPKQEEQAPAQVVPPPPVKPAEKSQTPPVVERNAPELDEAVKKVEELIQAEQNAAAEARLQTVFENLQLARESLNRRMQQEALRRRAYSDDHAQVLAGRRLAVIDARGVKGPLLLPVHVGDILTQPAIKETFAEMKKLDENLSVVFSPVDEGEARLRITREPRRE